MNTSTDLTATKLGHPAVIGSVFAAALLVFAMMRAGRRQRRSHSKASNRRDDWSSWAGSGCIFGVRGPARSSRPTIVLSIGGGGFAVDWSLVQRPLSETDWRSDRLRIDLSKLSERGRLVADSLSGHQVQLNNPMLVVALVREAGEGSTVRATPTRRARRLTNGLGR